MNADPKAFSELVEKYEALFGDVPIGAIEVGPDEYTRLLAKAIDTGKAIRRSDFFSEDAII